MITITRPEACQMAAATGCRSPGPGSEPVERTPSADLVGNLAMPSVRSSNQRQGAGDDEGHRKRIQAMERSGPPTRCADRSAQQEEAEREGEGDEQHAEHREVLRRNQPGRWRTGFRTAAGRRSCCLAASANWSWRSRSSSRWSRNRPPARSASPGSERSGQRGANRRP